MCLQKPRFPAAHDLSLAGNILPVSLLKTTMQEYTPDPEVIPLGLLHRRSRVPLQQKHIITSRKQVHSVRFCGDFKFLCL